ncbi:MAG TPA: prepilin-type N-terminal cleavage/methylation domain-containing protein [Candidatus Polarisedimenticolaceae bacterium]
MDPAKLARRRPDSGLTLVEILVATAVLAIAIVIALMIYDQSRRSFKQGENAVEQQQAVRIAFDRLNADLRMAGYNYNPDGNVASVDEQIEAAYDGAIVIRGDFDGQEEPALVGPAAASVSVGNDEIVIYALSKPEWISSGTGGQTLTFSADVQEEPRDGEVETVSVPNVALVQTAAEAPYTLYRITLNADESTWGSGGFITRTPLVENIRSMTYRYFGQTQTQINTLDLGSATDDIGGAETAASKATRLGIRRVNVSLIGLTRDPDMNYVDPADAEPSTRRYRKFELVGDVTPRNLGMKGIRDLIGDSSPPSQPGAPTLLAGHCGGLYVSWPPNDAEEGVTSYRVLIGTTAGSPTSSRSSSTNAAYVSGLTTGTTYYVAITALDAAGNESIRSSERNAAVTNTTVPSAPATVSATDSQPDAVNVTWTAVTTNTAALAGDPQSPTIRDLAGYRIYRGTSANFSPAAGNRIVDETVSKPSPTPSAPDTTVVNCRDYFYKVRAVDSCGTESDDAPGALGEAGRAESEVEPATPQNVQAFITGVSRVTVSWDVVNENIKGQPIRIDDYEVIGRRCLILDTDCQNDPSGYTPVGTATNGNLSLVDTGASGIDVLRSWYYRVRAKDDCPNYSSWSELATARCTFLGSLTWVTPNDGDPVSGVTPIRVAAYSAGVETYADASLTIVHGASGATETRILSPRVVGDTTYFEYDWLATPPGQYTLTITVPNAGGCTKSSSIQLNAAPTVACCLSFNPGVAGAARFLSCTNETTDGNDQECRDLNYKLWNNACLTSVRVDSLTIAWTNVKAPQLTRPALLEEVFFGGSSVWVPGNAATPASTTFSSRPPLVPYTRNAANTVDVTYRFADEMSREAGGKHQPVDTTFNFTLLDSAGAPTGITGTCGVPNGFSFSVPDPLSTTTP